MNVEVWGLTSYQPPPAKINKFPRVDPIKFAWETMHPNKPFPPQLEKGLMSTGNRGDRS